MRNPNFNFSLPLIALALLAGCERAPELTPCEPASGRPQSPESGAANLWGENARPVLHLVDCPAQVSGPEPPGSQPLQIFVGEALASWKKKGDEQGVKLKSPRLNAAAGESARLRITLTPGGAREVWVFPLLSGRQTERVQRELRTFRIALERDAAPDVPVSIDVDLSDALQGNWGDQNETGQLAFLEIALPRALPEQVQLHEVILDGASRSYDGAPAGTGTAELGILRPVWFVNGGASARITVRVPQERPELRWHDGASVDGGRNLVRVLDEGRSSELSTSPRKAKWKHRSVSLARWAGRTVVLEFSAEGEGVGFFGDPRVLSAGAPAGARLGGGGAPKKGEGEGAPGVLVYLIDTLRADHIGAWGADVPAKTPVLDRLAREGVMFRQATSSSPWTKPAIVTLMTGIWPTTHRVGARSYSDRLPNSVATVQERFRAGGWRTGSFAASPLGSTLSSLERDFDATAPPRHWRGRLGLLGAPTADQLHSEFLTWLQEEADQPSFAYIHTLEVHQHQSLVYDSSGKKSAAGYPRAVSDADRKLGHLLKTLETASESIDLSRWIVVVVSDHGESLGERGLEGHGTSLDQTQIRIPLIFWAPDLLKPSRIDHPVGLPDLAPTLLDLAGLPPLDEADGISLTPYLRGELEPLHDFVAAALLRYIYRPQQRERFALIFDDLGKVVRTREQGERHVDLARESLDPRDAPPDLDAAATPRLTRALDDWLRSQARAADAFRLRHGKATSVPLAPDDTERLRALGYVE